ncbi:MAG: DUF4845 domain-containing protein [Steroidobacteraceae bacterium]
MFVRQRGATFLGMLIIGSIVGLALYAGMRLWPLYFEYMEVARAMDQTAKEHAGKPTSPQELRDSLDRRWTIEDIKSITPKQMEIKRAGSGYTMRAAYRAEAPFIANVSLVVDFDKSVDVR